MTDENKRFPWWLVAVAAMLSIMVHMQQQINDLQTKVAELQQKVQP